MKRRIRRTLKAVKAGRANRALAVILALTLVLGMVSGAFSVDKISATDETEEAELAVGDSVTYAVGGDLTSASTSALDTSVAEVSLSAKSVTADNSSYVLSYTRGDITCYLTFSYDADSSTLSVDAASSYDEATPVTWWVNSYLTFSQNGTTYYLNLDSGALTADTSGSTAWSYNTSLGFYCTADSVTYYLAAFAGYTTDSTSPGSSAPSGSTMVSYAAGATSGVYTLSFEENGTTKYLVLSVDSSAASGSSNISASVTESSNSATQFTFDGTSITFAAAEVEAESSSLTQEETTEDAGTVTEDAESSAAAGETEEFSVSADADTDADDTADGTGASETSAGTGTSTDSAGTGSADTSGNADTAEDTETSESLESSGSSEGSGSTAASDADASDSNASSSSADSSSSESAGSSSGSSAGSSSSERSDSDSDSLVSSDASAGSSVSEASSNAAETAGASDTDSSADGINVSSSSKKGIAAYAAGQISAAFSAVSTIFANVVRFTGGTDVQAAQADADEESDTDTETGGVTDAATVSETAAASEDETTAIYYLDINPNGGNGYLIAQTSETRTSSTSYNAAWLYDPDEGFFCRKSYTFYLMVSAAADSAGTTYSLVLSTDSSSSGSSSTTDSVTTTKSLLAANAVTDITFYLTCRLNSGSTTYYLAFSPDTSGSAVSAASAKTAATELTCTTDGHLYFTEDGTKYYLALPADGENLSVTTDESKAAEAAYKLANGSAWSYGFTFTSTSTDADTDTSTAVESDNLYLSGSPILAAAQTDITFTGVSSGTTSVTIGEVTYNIIVYTKIITIEEGETYVDSLEGESSSFTAAVADESIAAAAVSDTTVNYTGASVSQGSSTEYVLGYAVSGVKYYFTFSCNGSTLTAGTTTYYYDGTGVTWDSNGYLSFTGSDGSTAYYLNVSDGALTASTTGSTVWTYDASTGFAVSSSDDSGSTNAAGTTLLDLLAAMNPGGTVLTPVYTVNNGSYTLTYTDSSDRSTKYLAFSVSNGTLTANSTTASGSGTTVTYTTDGYLSFTNSSDSITYYLYVDASGSLAASSDSADAAAWTYSPAAGLSCTVSTAEGSSGTTYYLSGTGVSESSGTDAVTFSASTNLCFALGFTEGNLTYYVSFGSSGYVNQLTTVLTSNNSVKGVLKVTYTADGYLKTNSGYYLNLSDGKISVSTTASTAWTYDPGNGFCCTDSSDTTWYLTDFLAFTSNTSAAAILGYGRTTGTAGTAVTFTGVSAGETTATLTYSGTNSSTNTTYTYKIIVTKSSDTTDTDTTDTNSDDTSSGETNSDGSSSETESSSGTAYVTTDTSPFVGSTVSTATAAGTYSTVSGAGYTGSPVTSVYLSLGLNYGISINVSTSDSGTTDDSTNNNTEIGVTVTSGGTWTIADASVACFDSASVTLNADGSVSLTDTDGSITIVGVSAGSTTLTYTTKDGASYTIPITIKDFWGYAGSSSTSIKVYELYMSEVTDTTAYMAVLYGEDNANVSCADYVKVIEGEVIYISFPSAAATAVDFFGTPDENYALTLLGSTNSASHYMAIDSTEPGKTEFVAYMTAAGYNQAYYYGSSAVFSAVQAAIDYESDGGMGFTRPATDTSNCSSTITVRSQPLATVEKEITSVTKTDEDGNTTKVSYTDGMHISVGDVIHYTITVTQYATSEAISYTDEELIDTLTRTNSDGSEGGGDDVTLTLSYVGCTTDTTDDEDTSGSDGTDGTDASDSSATLDDSGSTDSSGSTDTSNDGASAGTAVGSSDLNLSDEAVTSAITYIYTTSYTVQQSDYLLLLENSVSLSYDYLSEYSTSSNGANSSVASTVTLTRVVTNSDDETILGDEGYKDPNDTDDTDETTDETEDDTDETTDETEDDTGDTEESEDETGDTGETENETEDSNGEDTSETSSETADDSETADADGEGNEAEDDADEDDADASDTDDTDAADEDDADSSTASMSKTGDSTNIGIWIALLVIAAAAVIAVIAVRIRRRKRRR